jgi:chromosome segregation ATPase
LSALETNCPTTKNKLNECVGVVNQANETIGKCQTIVNSSMQEIQLHKEEIKKCEEIVETEKKVSVDQKDQITSLEKEKTVGKTIFGVLGFIVGLLLHIPIHF